jgi:hypothetical protein
MVALENAILVESPEGETNEEKNKEAILCPVRE